MAIQVCSVWFFHVSAHISFFRVVSEQAGGAFIYLNEMELIATEGALLLFKHVAHAF